MTQRSLLAGQLPILIHAGTDVQVEGWEGDRVQAETDSRWGLQVERRSESEFGRIRAQVGDFTLLDVGLDKNVINGLRNVADKEVIDVKIHSGGTVLVPFNSVIKIYAGKSVVARNLHGPLDVYAGTNVTVQQVQLLGQASAGHNLDLSCAELIPGDHKFTAGRDLRFDVASLKDVRLMVHDLGGKWQASIGTGETKIALKAGGDVTIITDQELTPQAPAYLLGTIHKRGTVGT